MYILIKYVSVWMCLVNKVIKDYWLHLFIYSASFFKQSPK